MSRLVSILLIVPSSMQSFAIKHPKLNKFCMRKGIELKLTATFTVSPYKRCFLVIGLPATVSVVCECEVMFCLFIMMRVIVVVLLTCSPPSLA